jgi:hypothetical protein
VDRAPDELEGDVWWGVQSSWFGVGDERTLCGNYTFASGGTHQIYSQVDTCNWVTEQYEGNNAIGPVDVTVTGTQSLEVPTEPTPAERERRSRPTPTPGP